MKNIKRHQRLIKRDGGNADEFNIIPTTYALPQDYALFVEVWGEGGGKGLVHGQKHVGGCPLSRCVGLGVLLSGRHGCVCARRPPVYQTSGTCLFQGLFSKEVVFIAVLNLPLQVIISPILNRTA